MEDVVQLYINSIFKNGSTAQQKLRNNYSRIIAGVDEIKDKSCPHDLNSLSGLRACLKQMIGRCQDRKLREHLKCIHKALLSR